MSLNSWDALLDRLRAIRAAHPDAVLASSLSVEDMVLTHALFAHAIDLPVVMLDTGRLHGETLALADAVAARYGKPIQIVHPDATAVADHVARHGAFAFYDSVELRKACCALRKVQPLQGVLHGRSAWITGMRSQQAVTRQHLPLEQFDSTFGLKKFNPLAQWTADDVWETIAHFQIPYNPLHDQGYPSIGCEPCTRAVRPGEDARAGRWWWERADSRECGLHAQRSPLQ